MNRRKMTIQFVWYVRKLRGKRLKYNPKCNKKLQKKQTLHNRNTTKENEIQKKRKPTTSN